MKHKKKMEEQMIDEQERCFQIVNAISDTCDRMTYALYPFASSFQATSFHTSAHKKTNILMKMHAYP